MSEPEENLKTLLVHGHHISYESDHAHEGVSHIMHRMTPLEAKELLHRAKTSHEAHFPDSHGQHFVIRHHDGHFIVEPQHH